MPKVVVAILNSDVPGPAQSHEPSQAEPVWAMPCQAIGDGPAMALAWLRVAESQSHQLRPQHLSFWSSCWWQVPEMAEHQILINMPSSSHDAGVGLKLLTCFCVLIPFLVLAAFLVLNVFSCSSCMLHSWFFSCSCSYHVLGSHCVLSSQHVFMFFLHYFVLLVFLHSSHALASSHDPGLYIHLLNSGLILHFWSST